MAPPQDVARSAADARVPRTPVAGFPPATPPSKEVPVGANLWRVHVEQSIAVVELLGDWMVNDPGRTPHALSVLDAAGIHAVRFDARSLGHWDSSLLGFLWELQKAASQKNLAFDQTGLPAAARRLLALLPRRDKQMATPGARPTITERVGIATLAQTATAVGSLAVVGEAVLRSGAAIGGRARMRGVDLIACMRDAGIAALPIVAVVNILVGAILAFVGAVQLTRFGAAIYVANLVGVAVVREMAPLMTAIVVAGRTGAAYASQIASMQGAEEIDALRVVGIPVYDYLLLPRVLALTTMMPLLALYGGALGIIGGFAVAVPMLHLSPESFFTQIRQAVTVSQIVFGLAKSVAFGALIALVGCQVGMMAGRSASDVGRAATTTVVIGIVGVIALDAVFAVCANAVGF